MLFGKYKIFPNWLIMCMCCNLLNIYYYVYTFNIVSYLFNKIHYIYTDNLNSVIKLAFFLFTKETLFVGNINTI